MPEGTQQEQQVEAQREEPQELDYTQLLNIPQYTTPKEVDKLFEGDAEQYWETLTPEQQDQIRSFSKNSRSLNAYMRGEQDEILEFKNGSFMPEPVEDPKKWAQLFYKTINEHQIPHDVTLTHYTTSKEFEKIFNNGIGYTASYLSTYTVADYTTLVGKGRDVQIRIRAQKGTRGLYRMRGLHDDEKETILSAGTKMKIIEEHQEGDMRIVDVAIIS